MIEGLWVVQFLAPNDPAMDLNGGVVVIETGRILGGDSGYYYVGHVSDFTAGQGTVSLDVHRHDQNIVSIFGDVDSLRLSGEMTLAAPDASTRTVVITRLRLMDTDQEVVAKLTKVAELP